jgi:GR25 family glycosyltransferase involved in LPS biosynthesis
MIPLLVINMKDSDGRRAFMQDQLAALSPQYRILDAIDGRTLSDAELNNVAPGRGVHYGGLLTPGEIGCALSHLQAIREIAEGDSNFGAVLEDDTIISSVAARFFDERTLLTLPPFDMLQLSENYRQRRGLAMEVGRMGETSFCALPKCHYTMHGLIYSRNAARRIAATITSITAPIDNMLFHDCRVMGLRVMEARPPVIRVHWAAVSVIGSRFRSTDWSTKLRREVRRYPNALRRWCSFVRAWGFPAIFRLRRGRQHGRWLGGEA